MREVTDDLFSLYALIATSAQSLVTLSQAFEYVFLTRVGTANGKLPWPNVRTLLTQILIDRRFVIVSPPATNNA